MVIDVVKMEMQLFASIMWRKIACHCPSKGGDKAFLISGDDMVNE